MAGRTVCRVRATHQHDFPRSSAGTLDEGVTLETKTMVERRTKRAEYPVGEVPLSREADRMQYNFQLCQDVKTDEHARFTMASLYMSGDNAINDMEEACLK